MNTKFIYYVFYSILQIKLIQCICEYQFNKSTTFKTPLWFDSDGNLLFPDVNGKIELKSGSLFLQCSYVPTNEQPVNEIQIKDKSFKTVEVSCKSNNVWHRVDSVSEEFDPYEAHCERDQLIHVWNARLTNPTFPLSQSAKDKCKLYDSSLQNSYLWNGIGLYTDKFKMIPLVENCLNIATSTPVFSVHQLKIKSSGFSDKKFSFVRGPPNNLPGFNPDQSYKQSVQENVLKQILGKNFDKYFPTKDYFDKGHLAPNADFPLDILRKATYYFSNALPESAKLNQVQWLSVESAIRNLKKTLEVITGGSDILQLPDNNDQRQDIYLAQPRLPVPKYFWKIIRDSDENTMGFSMINIPEESIQASRCSTYGWNLPSTIECFGPNDATPFTRDLPEISSRGPLRGN